MNYFNWFERFSSEYGYPFDRHIYIIMQRFLNLYMKRFQYEGFSDKFKERYGNRNLFELFQFFSPATAWFKDGTGELMCLPVSGNWKINAVGKPTEWSVWAINGEFRFNLSEKNSVLMFNDEALSIPYIQLLYEADYMRRLDMAMKQNIELQSTPYIVEAFDEEAKGVSKWTQLVKNFASRIVIRKKRDKNSQLQLPPSQVLKTDVPIQIKEFMTAYNEFMFRGMTYLGFKNVNIEKSERLLTGEISANDMILQDNYTNSLDMRAMAFDEIDRKLGVKVTVKPVELKTLIPDLTAVYAGMNRFNQGGNENDSKRPAAE